MSLVRDLYPLWHAPCNGYENEPQPWGCIAGEIRSFYPTGEVQVTSLQHGSSPWLTPTLELESPPTPFIPVVIQQAPLYSPQLSTVPEPSYNLLLAIVGLLLMIYHIRKISHE